MGALEGKIASIRSSTAQEEAFNRFDRVVRSYGYSASVYSFLTDHPSVGQTGHTRFASTYPEDWLDRYEVNGYRRADPVHERLLRGHAPFYWADLVQQIRNDPGISAAKRKAALWIMAERRNAGLVDGLGVSLVSSCGGVAAIGLSRPDAAEQRRYEALAEIAMLAMCFHETFLSFFDQPQVPRLTPRECEVLLRAAEGRTDYDMSCMLNVSESTIRFHWNNIFAKLGVRGRMSAVIKAMQLQLVTPQNIQSVCGS